MSVIPPLYSIPISKRPGGYGSWYSKILFPLIFDLGLLGINSVQFLFLFLLLIPGERGREFYRRAIDWTKDGFGRLIIAITVLFAPTSLVLTTDDASSLQKLVDRDEHGNFVRVNLPDRLVLMANHQMHGDWMYLWILACYSGHAEGLIILLKASLKHLPVVGWGMRFFRFIFLNRSWASDRDHLTKSLNRLSRDVMNPAGGKRAPLCLVIFPEGTITSDDERAKSARYAKRQGIDDFVGVLQPRTTGILFCLRTLLPTIPDLQLLDVTISYPGVPFGKYPQDWYTLGSIFFHSVPPPTVRMHLRLYSDLTSLDCEIPSLRADPVDGQPGLASPEESAAFELWLRNVWTDKERRIEDLSKQPPDLGGENCQILPVSQLSAKDWFAAFGGGGLGTAAVAAFAAHRATT